MTSATESKFAEGVRPYLEEGEEVLVSCVAQSRGRTQYIVSGLQFGGGQLGQSLAAAKESAVRVENPMALILTDKHLITAKISSPIGLGIGGKVKEVMSVLPFSEIDSISNKRIALRQNISLVVRGTEIKLETNAKASSGELAERFTALKSAN